MAKMNHTISSQVNKNKQSKKYCPNLELRSK